MERIRKRRRTVGPILPEFDFVGDVASPASQVPETINAEFQAEKVAEREMETLSVPVSVPKPEESKQIGKTEPSLKDDELLHQEPNATRRETMKTSTTTPAPGISEFRRNADRQIKEQKSMGSILSGIAYAVFGSILLVAALAGFGGYVLWKQIQNQSVTVTQLDQKYNAEVIALQEGNERLQDKMDAVTKKHQEQLIRLQGISDENAALLRKREKDLGSLQQRVKRLEDQSRFTSR